MLKAHIAGARNPSHQNPCVLSFIPGKPHQYLGVNTEEVCQPAARLGVAKEDTSKEIFTILDLRKLVALKRYDNPDWMRAVVMLYTGLRREEAKHLTFADLDLQARLLHVRKGKGIQGGKYRIVPLQEEFCAHIAGARKAAGTASPLALVCGLTGEDVKLEWNHFRSVLRLAGIEPDRGKDQITGRERRLSPHSCRHTYCALELATGMDSSSLALRHFVWVLSGLAELLLHVPRHGHQSALHHGAGPGFSLAGH